MLELMAQAVVLISVVDDVPKEHLGQTWLLLPLAVAAFSILAGYGIYAWKREQVDALLSRHRGSRVVFFAFAVVILPLIAGAWADIIDISAILEHGVPKGRLIPMCVLALTLGVYSFCQMIWWDHGTRWEERVTKAENRASQQEALKLEIQEQRDMLGRLLNLILSIVGCKRDRMQTQIKEGKGSANTIQAIRETLGPRDQIVEQLNAMHRFLFSILDKNRPGHRLRIAYFDEVISEKRLRLVYAWDGQTRNCIKSREVELLPALKLENSMNSLAVYAVCTDRISYAADADSAANDEGNAFRYTRPSQSDDIASMVAIPLGVSHNRDGTSQHHVVSIDTDCRGFFGDGIREAVKLVRDNLSHRLHLEIYSDMLLDSQG